jgi:predicted ferric reductase
VAHAGLWDQTVIFNTQYQDVFLATVGTIIFFTASFFSLQAIRAKMRYEIWYLLHVTVYLGILFTFLHQIKTGGDFINNHWFTVFWYMLYILAFVIWLRYRVLNPIVLAYKHGFKVESITQTAANTYSVRLTGWDIRNFEFQPGQYATWRFLSSNLWYEAHPFSISSPVGSSYLQFTVKVSPALISKIANVKPGTYVLVDGPRGSFTAERAENTPKVVLIAGGIGVAPYISIIDDLIRQGKDVTLLYAAHGDADIAFRSELTQLQTKGLKVSIFINEKNQQITPEILMPYAQDDTTIYICGPDGMSRAFNTTLQDLGFPKENIITERFAF